MELKNILINDDSIEYMKSLDENSIDLIFADPPYWMRTTGTLKRVEGTNFDGCNDEWDKFNSLKDYKEFTKKWLIECKRILKKDGSIFVIGGMQCIYTIGAIMQELDFWLINDIIWHKSNPTPNFKGTRLNNSHETIIWAAKSIKSKVTFNYKTAKELNNENIEISKFTKGERKQMGSVWKFPICSGLERLKDEEYNKLHSTQKPEALLYRIIAISSKIGDTILDPFAGTMTTGAMAKKMGRNCIMIEKDLKYFTHGKKRVDFTKMLIGDIEKSIFDNKPTKVHFKDLISKNYLKVGDKFTNLSNDDYATLRDDGKLYYNNEVLDIHTCAAKFANKNADRINGFDYWYVVRNNHLVFLNDIREKARKDIEKLSENT
ncbi:DNA-methyltransferase [Mycoplasma crocodyli]|uniref:Methyltransferase n=1 Tax=Mycoplasma crocodyli (strain ATCC 51981 / MP145) TaxID=512564 RepID=D5E5Y9_MYCCM|nr:site-specific DNA-methyltransferase [Mycoplasma crocodyli]ADE19472.1 adenine-specific DNA modification methyltransferase [Mycoplasma crocodyli MP145]